MKKRFGEEERKTVKYTYEPGGERETFLWIGERERETEALMRTEKEREKKKRPERNVSFSPFDSFSL